MLSLSDESFELWRHLLRDLAGLDLQKEKGYLLEARLSPLLQVYGLTDLDQLYAVVNRDWHGPLPSEVIQVMTTHETNFFRHPPSFEVLGEILKERTAAGRGPVRVLSAGCSTGEEVWSMAITAAEALGPDWHRWVRISGLDIAPTTIAAARNAVYQIPEGKMSAARIARWFTPAANGMRVVESLRRHVFFEVRNLLDPITQPRPYDVIFNKNTAYYFEPEIRRNFFDNMRDRLAPDGILIIGSSESLVGVSEVWSRERQGKVTLYRPKPRLV